jgi:hypothetical protein
MLVYIAVTLGAGTIVWGVNTNTAGADPSGGTVLTPINALLGGVAGKGLTWQGATLNAAPTIFRPFSTIGAFAGGADLPGPMVEYVNGRIVVGEGAHVSLQGIAGAGTTPLVLLGMVWEEVAKG